MIPQGWEEKTLGEVCEIISGTTPDTSNDEFWGKGNYWITPAEINENSLYINSTERTITDKAVEYCSLRRMPRGTVLFSSRAPIGKIAISNVDSLYCNQGFKNFICSKNIHNKFLYYFLLKSRKYLISLGKGATFKEVSKSIISTVNIQYPPLPKQERIVAKLDEAFEAIDKAKTIAETNLKNAKELFESALNNVFTKNTDGWEEKKLDDVCTYKSGTTISKDLEKDTGDLLYIKVGDMNIRGNEELITTSTRFASSAEISAAQIIPTGSVIFPKRGGAIATNKKRKIIKPTIVDLNTMAIIPNKELDSNFFYYWFGQINLIDISNGTTIPQINNYSFQNLRIKYPTLLEQQKIVEQLDKIQEKTKKLEAIYTQKIKECDELKQSILQKAFRGEL